MDHKQTSLDCAVRIANTLLMQGQMDPSDKVVEKILSTAKVFEAYLGPDPVRSFGGPRQDKPTFDKPCPICKSEMWDMRSAKKNPNAPDARCKQAGKWNASENRYEGCQGVIWPDKE